MPSVAEMTETERLSQRVPEDDALELHINMGFAKIGGYLFGGVPISRILVFGGLYWGNRGPCIFGSHEIEYFREEKVDGTGRFPSNGRSSLFRIMP